MSKKDCESCAKWERSTFKSLFIYCPQCGRERTDEMRRERDRKAALVREEQVRQHKESDAYLRAIQAILDVYDDYVTQYGPNSKHVFFIVTYRAIAERLNTTTYQVRKVLLGGVNFEEVLVKHGRGFFWESGPPHHFRHFTGFETDDHEKEKREIREWATARFYKRTASVKCA